QPASSSTTPSVGPSSICSANAARSWSGSRTPCSIRMVPRCFQRASKADAGGRRKAAPSAWCSVSCPTASSIGFRPTEDEPETLVALHARTADDRVTTVGEPHPGLALAVVVRRPDDERRVVAADAHPLRALRLDAAPDPDERVLLPPAPHRRLAAVPPEPAPLVPHRHEDLPP